MHFSKHLFVFGPFLVLAFGCSASNDGEGGAVWSADSVGFELKRISYPSGYRTLHRGMIPSAAQLEALRSLRLIQPTGQCGSDGLRAELTIRDSGGAERRFRWTDGQSDCFEGEAQLEPAGYARLLEALPNCHSPGQVPLNGCTVLLGAEPSNQRTLSVAAGERYRLGLIGCESAELTLADATGTPVAVDSSAAGQDCARLEHAFATGGDYVVSWPAAASRGGTFLYGERITD